MDSLKLPEVMPEDKSEQNIIYRAHIIKLEDEIKRLEALVGEWKTNYQRVKLESDRYQVKYTSACDHYDTLLEKILDKIK